MNIKLETIIFACAILISSYRPLGAQVGIGTDNPNPSSALDVFSNEKGLLIPRLTDEQRDAIENPASGLTIYNMTSGCYNYYTGEAWMEICGQLIGKINTINCLNANNTGTLIEGIQANGVSSTIPYTGGNGGIHKGQTVASTVVTGLTATLLTGNFNEGNGTITYTITGTATSSGTASFNLKIGGQMCVLFREVLEMVQYPPGTVHCSVTPTVVISVLNPITGKTWMDRNLGASQVATSPTDVNAYGSLYQWGRFSDGHQCRNSAVTPVLSNSDTPGHGLFISVNSGVQDWRSPQNSNLWQSANGINNPCPVGYRLPSESELNAERQSWSSNNSAGAFNSPLKLTAGGHRAHFNSFIGVGTEGNYWTSTPSGTSSRSLGYNSTTAGMWSSNRGSALSIRCIMN